MGKSTPSQPPSSSQTASSQQQFNQQDFAFKTAANNPNSVSPIGNVTYTGSPGSAGYTQTTSLTPPLQEAIESQQNVIRDRSSIAEALTPRVQDELGTPVDYSKFAEMGQLEDYNARRDNAETASYDRFASRLDPQFEQAQQKMEIQLNNQGLVAGDEAFDDAMGNFNRNKTDAYAAAVNDSIRAGREESQLGFQQNLASADFQNASRNQQINEELQRRGWSINEINALLNGTSVSLPSSNTYNASNAMGTTDVLGSEQLSYDAGLDRFNAKQQQKQGLFGGISSGISSGLQFFG
jgi:hypothetical protein